VVLIVPTTQPEVIEQYSIRVVDQWKLGRGKVDDGVLLLIALNDRKVRIEVAMAWKGRCPMRPPTGSSSRTSRPHSSAAIISTASAPVSIASCV